MNIRQLCLSFAAIGVIFLVLAGAFILSPTVAKPFLALSAMFFILATGIRIKLWRDVTSDPYSLVRLNQVIREGTYEEADVPDVDHDGDKYCLCCHTVYGSQFGTCPNCAKK